MEKKLFLPCLVFLAGIIAIETVGQISNTTLKNIHQVGKYKGFINKGVKNSYSGVGFSVNALNYFGDLAPFSSRFSTDISFTKPGFGISVFRRYYTRYALQVQYMYGTLKGSDKESSKQGDETGGYRYQRNLSFRNRIHELSVIAYIDLFETYSSSYISRVKWTPYAYFGVAGFYHNPQALAPEYDLQKNKLPQAGQWVDLQPLGTEGQKAKLNPDDTNYGLKPYSLIQVSIPIGIGARVRLTNAIDLWADIGLRYTFTDYLDDVSGNYVDLGVFDNPLVQAMSYRSNELSASDYISKPTTYQARDGKTYTVISGYGTEHPESKRGNKKLNDIFMVTSIKVTYVLESLFQRPKSR